MKYIEAAKIYFSAINTGKNKKRITRGDLIAFSFLFYLTIPMTILIVPFIIHKIKKKGIKKSDRKHYLYFDKGEKR